MFKVGQSVVHRSHGVGIIQAKIKRKSPTGEQEFYIIEIQDNGAPKKVFVPVEQAHLRVRKLVCSTQQAWNILSDKNAPQLDNSTWNRRYREYMELLQTGELTSVAMVIHALMHLKNEKDLSFGERKLLDCALDQFVKEVMAVDKLDRDAVDAIIAEVMK